jgi:hypothetical protein
MQDAGYELPRIPLVTQAINVYTAWSGQRREQENQREEALQKYFDEKFSSEPSDNDQKAATMAKAHALLLLRPEAPGPQRS